MSTRKYETVPGFFVQDDPYYPSTDQVPILPRFGLIDECSNRWRTFTTEIHRLNATAPRGVQYKVFFIGRHGQGFHNVAEEKYGTQVRSVVTSTQSALTFVRRLEAWNEYWSKIDGDGQIVWGPDPQLTPLGELQARDAHAAWQTERRFGIPVPEKLYTSPLKRAIRTNQITFDDPIVCRLKTTIVENIREQYGIHTCDKRRTRSEIHAEFPEYIFEDGFTEADLLWKPGYRETHADIDHRVTRVLDAIFRNNREQFISITTHGGFVGGFLRVCHHLPWILPTGGVIPVVVKASVTNGQWCN